MSGVDLCGIELAYPVINGSGTFDAIAALDVFGDVVLREFPFSAYVSKTITPEPRPGNPPPRLWEEARGLVNSIGLPNKGVAGFLDSDLRQLQRLPVPLIVSAMATSPDEFAAVVEALDEASGVSAIELNLSCPNVKSGLVVGESPEEAATLMGCLRPLTRLPLIVKLSSSIDPGPVAESAVDAGADALSLVNTLSVSPLSPNGAGPWLGAGSGGLSGPAISDLALGQVEEVAGLVEVPIIGMGGVSSGSDALRMLDSGASIVAVGTENFRDPTAGTRIAGELEQLLGSRTSADLSSQP